MPTLWRDSISLLDSLVSWMQRMSACRSLSTFERPQTLLLSIGRRPLTFQVIMRRALAPTGRQAVPVSAPMLGILSGVLLLSNLHVRLPASHATLKQCSFPQVKAASAFAWKLREAQTPFSSPYRAPIRSPNDFTDTTRRRATRRGAFQHDCQECRGPRYAGSGFRTLAWTCTEVLEESVR